MRLVSREVVVHADKGVIADQFYAERLYTKDSIAELLERAGFHSIRHFGSIVSESDRNQDLGMMAHRMFLTARAPKKIHPVLKPSVPFPEVTVLLGDPMKPDILKRDGRFNEEDYETVERLKAALSELEDYKFEYLDNHSTLISDLRERMPSFVMNLCDEGFNNDAFKELHVPAILEMLDIPYTGAGPACLALCYNKSIVRAVAMALDIPVPLETYCGPEDQMATLPCVFPALIKPNFGDSSLGITQDAVVFTPQELFGYLRELWEKLPNIPILIQEFLSGPEYSVGIIGNPGLTYHTLPILEVDYSGLDPTLPRILGYESKWLPGSPYWESIQYREAKIDEDTRRKLLDYSNLLFERLGCRDYARFDFRADENGEIKLLEVNPNPGWCWDGKLNMMAGFEGLRYSEMLRMILEVAQERVLARGCVPAPSKPLAVRR